jgi:hypothetical protein
MAFVSTTLKFSDLFLLNFGFGFVVIGFVVESELIELLDVLPKFVRFVLLHLAMSFLLLFLKFGLGD